MSRNVIEIEQISKRYRLDKISTGAISRDLTRWWTKRAGHTDPLLKIGTEIHPGKKDVWALKDVSINIRQGEVWGLVGGNGSGKSTLLKILSRITKPSGGSIRVKGRIASLLEVGTGFHPDLTGRENVFLNGAILGMRKNEIQTKLSEIVDFADIEKYLDTPVKRYSSGMYVRLAFAVAAHLEPEILILDEVLAVGDIDFQKKCLAKMKEVSQKQGRTVIFVSHNMDSVKTLCTQAVLLKNGQVYGQGNPDQITDIYLAGD